MREATRFSPRGLCAALVHVTMLALLLGTASTARAEEAGGDKVYYGTDDRIDLFEETDATRIEWAQSTCALVGVSQLSEQADGSIELQTFPYVVGGVEACEDEPFKDQPIAAFCTGFVVGQDLIATAGHCILDEVDLATTAFVFGYEMLNEGTAVTEFNTNQVYFGVEIVDRALGGALDHAIIRVDRPITAPGAEILPIRREGDIALGDQVGTIGYPTGLPTKLSFGDDTEVKEENNQFYFSSNLDAAGGNSGSPVFSVDDEFVEGILVRGPAAQFVLQPEGCFNVSTFPDDGALVYVDSSKFAPFSEFIPENGLSERGFDFRATPVRTAADLPAIALTWIDPDLAGYEQATLVRGATDYPQNETEGAVVFTGRASSYLDSNVLPNTRYFYTLFVRYVTGLKQVSFATTVAGSDAPAILSEPFDADGLSGQKLPLDLNFTQITFTPTGAPTDRVGGLVGVSDYSAYEATIVKNIREFEVAREDSEGGSYNLPLSDSGSIGINLGVNRFPYFGRSYSRVYVNANGFLNFSSLEPSDPLVQPGILQHFAIPRISALFSDLAPSNGGQVWARALDDRIVVTYDNIREAIVVSPTSPPPPNSFQVELFYSGHIRITYKSLAARTVFVGLSDGRGVPRDPATVFPGVTSTLGLVDFSALAPEPMRLSIEPLSPVMAEEGDLINFVVRASYTPAGDGSTPFLSAEWTRSGAPPFGDNADGTGEFLWETGEPEVGTTTLRILASYGDERAFQDVRISVGSLVVSPEALNLGISTGTALEDPTETRIVPSTRPMFATYEYYHPKAATDPSYLEGPSILRWFRNGEIVPAFSDSLTIPAGATRSGDVWHFRIVPLTATYLAGEEAISPFLTVIEVPLIESVTPAVGLSKGGDTVRILGDRLGAPIRVLFGGVPVASVRSLGDAGIEVTTPVHAPGLVDVQVETAEGIGRAPGIYRYVNSLSDLAKEDLNADGKVDAVDVQIVVGAVLEKADAAAKAVRPADVNGDGLVDAADAQLVVNRALLR
ncbi:MAG: trypsin-like serine protease [Candidatus Hydrogenedens sp.]|nr:trypsin-like serine protease [Candidatus Hydrogenedens sp.]